VYLRGISDEYYGKLNKTEAVLVGKTQLKRHKFNAKGEYLKDQTGKDIFEDVPVPHDCVAVVSEVKLGVPLKYKSEKNFDFVTVTKFNNKAGFVYIIPKKYCVHLNKVALILSANRLRSYYYGLEIMLQNGHTLYLHVVPFRGNNQDKGQRVLCVKSVNNFSAELKTLIEWWVTKRVIYPMKLTALAESVNGVNNVAYRELGNTCADFEKFGSALAEEEN
jgi:hypothetical protein